MTDITRRKFCRTLVCAGGAVTLRLASASATNRPNGVPSIASSKPVPAESAVSAAQGLIRRLLPGYGDKIICETIPADNGRDVFEIQTINNHLVLRGNSGVSMASALNWYLEYYSHCQVSWCGDQLNLPNPLPTVSEKVRKSSPYKYRYAFNYCTFGYAMAFWDWKRWEREIDFMALNGINTPLAATGAEVVYRNVFRKLGVDDQAISGFIAGPPYLPWFLMSNLDGFGGPNCLAWYDRQQTLQRKILEREREFGMKPVLPGFSGHVPKALKEIFPQAKMTRLKSWNGFPGIWMLDPGDSLFRDIGERFVRETICLYGTDHHYSADPFNEMTPPHTDYAYLASVSRRIYEGITAVDPKAVWFMQDWLFLSDKSLWTQPRIKALLGGVPDDGMVIMDLRSDTAPMWNTTDAFFGKPWLWCIIHNWGGRQGMYGRLDRVGTELPSMLGNPTAGRLSGIGTLNEGNDVNPLVFDQFYGMAWRSKPENVIEWVHQYAWRRYGADNPNACKAWEILAKTLYECKDSREGPQGCFFAMPPSWSARGGGFVRASVFYNPSRVREAFGLLLKAANQLGNQDTYCFDLVDLGRQVMSDISQQLYAKLRTSFESRDAARFDRFAAAWMTALDDTDCLLRTNRMFQFGHYLEYPLKAASSPEDAARYEANAKRLITLWGGPESTLFGYAQRQYGGLMRDYNREAWQILLTYTSDSLHNGGKFDAAVADRMIREYTEAWIHRHVHYPAAAQGNAIAKARMILEKYMRTAESAGGQ